jgi:hypothetical protein
MDFIRSTRRGAQSTGNGPATHHDRIARRQPGPRKFDPREVDPRGFGPRKFDPREFDP